MLQIEKKDKARGKEVVIIVVNMCADAVVTTMPRTVRKAWTFYYSFSMNLTTRTTFCHGVNTVSYNYTKLIGDNYLFRFVKIILIKRFCLENYSWSRAHMKMF
jgi:hypothetical protein